METKFIKEHNTLEPNGYNILLGGAERNFSEIAKERLKETRAEKGMSDLTKLHIALSQIERCHDDTLPQHIQKTNGKYYVKYPVIENNIVTSYVNEPCKSLVIAKKRIAQLEGIYKSTEIITKVKQNKKDKTEKKRKPKEEEVLPKYVSEIHQDGYMLGYKVSGYKYSNGTEAPSKDCIGSPTNAGDLHNAKMYVEFLNTQNKNLSFVIPELPVGFLHFKEKNRLGTPVEGFKIRIGYKKSNNTNPSCNKNVSVYKKFSDMRITLEENYNKAKKFYEELEKNKNITFAKNSRLP